jgi:hypothetical protein
MIFPIKAHDWKQIIAEDELAGTPVLSDPILLADVAGGLEGHAQGMPWAFLEVVADRGAGADDDLTIEVFPCPGGEAARRATVAASTTVVTLATSSTVRQLIPVSWEDVADAFCVRASRDGSTDTLDVVVNVKRYRYQNAG